MHGSDIMNKQQYGTLDLFRLLAAVMVMAIHTAPLESVNSELDYIFGIIIPRVAVPFFFMVSGQFTDFSRFFAVRKQLLKLSQSVEKPHFRQGSGV